MQFFVKLLQLYLWYWSTTFKNTSLAEWNKIMMNRPRLEEKHFELVVRGQQNNQPLECVHSLGPIFFPKEVSTCFYLLQDFRSHSGNSTSPKMLTFETKTFSVWLPILLLDHIAFSDLIVKSPLEDHVLSYLWYIHHHFCSQYMLVDETKTINLSSVWPLGDGLSIPSTPLWPTSDATTSPVSDEEQWRGQQTITGQEPCQILEDMLDIKDWA